MDRGEWLKTYALFGVLIALVVFGPAVGVDRVGAVILLGLFVWVFLERGPRYR